MTTFDGFDPFERRITDAVHEIADAHRPAYLDDILRLTARSPQRPRWASAERWLPLKSTVWRPSAVILLLAIVLLALLGAWVVGAAPHPSPLASDQVLAIADNGGLKIAASDGTNARALLSEGPAFEPRWSPDGSLVAVLIGEGRLHTLVIVRPDGTVVGRSAGVKEFWWLEGFVLVRRDNNRIDVLQPDLAREHAQTPIDVVAGGDPSSVSYDQPLRDLFAVRRDLKSGATNAFGGSPVNRGQIWFITFRPGHASSRSGAASSGTDARDMVWSPSESQLAFIDTVCDPSETDADCAGTLSTVDASGRNLRALIERVSPFSELVWDEAGRRILTSQVLASARGAGLKSMASVAIVDTADPMRVRQLTDATSIDIEPRWADAERRVTFLRSTAGVFDAWLVGADGSGATLLARDVNGVDWRPS